MSSLSVAAGPASSAFQAHFLFEISKGKRNDFLVACGILANDGLGVLFQDTWKISMHLNFLEHAVFVDCISTYLPHNRCGETLRGIGYHTVTNQTLVVKYIGI